MLLSGSARRLRMAGWSGPHMGWYGTAIPPYCRPSPANATTMQDRAAMARVLQAHWRLLYRRHLICYALARERTADDAPSAELEPCATPQSSSRRLGRRILRASEGREHQLLRLTERMRLVCSPSTHAHCSGALPIAAPHCHMTLVRRGAGTVLSALRAPNRGDMVRESAAWSRGGNLSRAVTTDQAIP
jgi:hypothetical protein